MGKRILLTEQDKINIVYLYTKEKLSVTKIATIYHCIKPKIKDALKEQNVPIKEIKPLTLEQELDIVKLYTKDKITLGEIKNICHVDISTIKKVLLKRKIKIKSCKDWQQEKIDNKEDEVLNLYVNKRIGIYEIASKLNIWPKTIKAILTRNNIYIRNKTEQISYAVDSNYFEIINSDEKAWLLGWIATDGFTNQITGDLGMGLNDGDIKIIKLFKKLVKSDKPIEILDKDRIKGSFRRNFDTARFRFRNKKMARDLYNLGLDNEKSYTLKFPPIDEKYFYALLRGAIEGDGEIAVRKGSNGKTNFTLVLNGHKDFLKGFADYFEKIGIFFGISRRKWKNRDGYCYRISLHNKLKIIQILDKMYENHNGLFLDRKYNTYLKMKKFLKEFPLKPQYITNNLTKTNWNKFDR